MNFLVPALTAILFAAPAFAGAEISGPEISGTHTAGEQQQILQTMDELDLWLDENTHLPRSTRPLARVELVPQGAEVLYEGQMTLLEDTVRGVYDGKTASIYLVRHWLPDDVHDRSVLLHELVHHRQEDAKHWYCPQAMEWDAYLIQEDYLKAHKQTGNFNWAWVLLQSSCALRDHHPD